MIQSLLLAFVKDILFFLQEKKTFFQLASDQRHQDIEQRFGSYSMARYFAETDEKHFLSDLLVCVQALREGFSKNMAESKLFSAFSNFFLQEFPESFDQLNRNFYQLSHEDQQKRLDVLFPVHSKFFEELKKILSVASTQEIMEAVTQFFFDLYQSPRIFIQSAVECGSKTKKEIRSQFLKKYPLTFAYFSTNAMLLGGMRFFADGAVTDHSWFSKIQQIKQLSYQV